MGPTPRLATVLLLAASPAAAIAATLPSGYNPSLDVIPSALARQAPQFDDDALPLDFTWGSVNGTSYLTKTLNQHIPQYCGSCWAHASLSALADRIKIARGPDALGVDVGFSVQALLNCGHNVAGTCGGGSASGTYHFIQERGYIPFDTCQQYLACSSDRTSEGFCPQVDFTCTPINECRTCGTFGEPCKAITHIPNGTVAEWGNVIGEKMMRNEIFARGPIACGLDSDPLHTYTKGVFDDADRSDKIINHLCVRARALPWGGFTSFYKSELHTCPTSAAPCWPVVPAPPPLPCGLWLPRAASRWSAGASTQTQPRRHTGLCVTAGVSIGARWAISG